jgi:hypothetical protein
MLSRLGFGLHNFGAHLGFVISFTEGLDCGEAGYQSLNTTKT